MQKSSSQNSVLSSIRRSTTSASDYSAIPSLKLFMSPAVLSRSSPPASNPTTLPRKEKPRFGEIAGSTAAGCAAICCCFPFSLMNLLVLACYKMPVGLGKKALHQKKRRRLDQTASSMDALRVSEAGIKNRSEVGAKGNRKDDRGDGRSSSISPSVSHPSPDGDSFEKQMLDRFSWTGFGRSPSQRET